MSVKLQIPVPVDGELGVVGTRGVFLLRGLE